uniref:Putative salivary secreted peptide n=1 Tax=Corethrella appendiculata TaxID=1370023 RepID=U5EYF4_9DIPT
MKKTFLITVVIAVVLAIVFSPIASQSPYSRLHNATWGYRGPYDQVLNYTIASVKGSIWQTKSTELVFPPRGQRNWRNITAINVFDQYYPAGEGGYATLKAGGPRFNHTTIKLKSQRGKGYNFVIEIYGR